VEYLRACLESEYQLEYAYNGRAGIEKALEIIPDIVISDVMMPEKNGFEVCETLKYDERTSHIPIVLLTAKATVEDRISGLQRGADAYMAKPFHRNELMAVLGNLIELRQKLQQRYASAQSALPPASDAGVQMEDAFLLRFRQIVEARLDDSSLTGEDVCRRLGMSYSVVYRKLSALTGRSLNVYIRLIRLQKAAELLSDLSLSVSEIAYQTGFNDPKFFSRVFAEEFKATPTEFRKKHSK
jgi:YesN/AraC family two-component response regulator